MATKAELEAQVKQLQKSLGSVDSVLVERDAQLAAVRQELKERMVITQRWEKHDEISRLKGKLKQAEDEIAKLRSLLTSQIEKTKMAKHPNEIVQRVLEDHGFGHVYHTCLSVRVHKAFCILEGQRRKARRRARRVRKELQRVDSLIKLQTRKG